MAKLTRHPKKYQQKCNFLDLGSGNVISHHAAGLIVPQLGFMMRKSRHWMRQRCPCKGCIVTERVA
eukprot:1151052-Amphidinium_carterae.1